MIVRVSDGDIFRDDDFMSYLYVIEACNHALAIKISASEFEFCVTINGNSTACIEYKPISNG